VSLGKAGSPGFAEGVFASPLRNIRADSPYTARRGVCVCVIIWKGEFASARERGGDGRETSKPSAPGNPETYGVDAQLGLHEVFEDVGGLTW
jgi:hypothetical protein